MLCFGPTSDENKKNKKSAYSDLTEYELIFKVRLSTYENKKLLSKDMMRYIVDGLQQNLEHETNSMSIVFDEPTLQIVKTTKGKKK